MPSCIIKIVHINYLLKNSLATKIEFSRIGLAKVKKKLNFIGS